MAVTSATAAVAERRTQVPVDQIDGIQERPTCERNTTSTRASLVVAGSTVKPSLGVAATIVSAPLATPTVSCPPAALKVCCARTGLTAPAGRGSVAGEAAS